MHLRRLIADRRLDWIGWRREAGGFRGFNSCRTGVGMGGDEINKAMCRGWVSGFLPFSFFFSDLVLSCRLPTLSVFYVLGLELGCYSF